MLVDCVFTIFLCFLAQVVFRELSGGAPDLPYTALSKFYQVSIERALLLFDRVLVFVAGSADGESARCVLA